MIIPKQFIMLFNLSHDSHATDFYLCYLNKAPNKTEETIYVTKDHMRTQNKKSFGMKYYSYVGIL